MTTDDIMALSIEIDAGLRAKLRAAVTAMVAERDALECARNNLLCEKQQVEDERDALKAALAAQAEPVASITECEACFTPDACRLRGKCDHYSAQQLRVAAQPQQPTAAPAEPVAFEHDIGADRYQVVKGSFWWHVRIGDGTANVGKFHTKMAAEDMALKLLTAFRDGAFMQSKAAQPQQATDAALEAATGEPHVDGWPLWSGLPPAAPVAWLVIDEDRIPIHAAPWQEAAQEHINDAIMEDLDEAKHWKVIPVYAKGTA